MTSHTSRRLVRQNPSLANLGGRRGSGRGCGRARGRGSGVRGEVGRRLAEDGGAELARVGVRDAEAELRPADDGDGDEVEGKQSATASSL